MSEINNGNIKRVERLDNTIKAVIAPLSTELKAKLSTAFQEVVTKIKEKHLS